MTPPRCYYEGFAGSYAVGLRLMRRGLIPPIGYMGGKRKHAESILALADLQPGDGADHYLLTDAGPWGWAWAGIFDPFVRELVVARLRSWQGRDPTELWRELAAAGLPEETTEAISAYLWLQGRAASCTPVWWQTAERLVSPGNTGRGAPGNTGPKGTLVMPTGSRWTSATRPAGPKTAAQHGLQTGGSRLVTSDHATGRTMAAGQTHASFVGNSNGRVATASQAGPRDDVYSATPRGITARGVWHPRTVAARLEAIGNAVASFLVLQGWAAMGKAVTPTPAAWKTPGYGRPSAYSIERDGKLIDVDELADRLPTFSASLVALHSEVLTPPESLDAEGWLVYLDPPYQGRTAYAAKCPRERVVGVSKAWAAAGALVLVSEAVPLEDLGWEAVEIADGEWVTCSSVPGRRPAKQLSLLGAA